MKNTPSPSPPPYHTVSGGSGQAPNVGKSTSSYEAVQPGDAPNTNESSAPPEVFLQQWSFACSFDPNKPVSLTANGKPISPECPDTSDAALPSANKFQRHGFQIDLTGSVITVTNGVDRWHCKSNSAAGEMLALKKPNLSLKNFGYFLVLFEHTSPSSGNEVFRNEADAMLRLLQVDQELCDNGPYRIFSIRGPRINEVQGDQQDLLIHAECNLILWNILRNKLSWKMWQGMFHITCLTPNYLVQLVGDFHLMKRSSGREIGTFKPPRQHEHYNLNKNSRLGPIASSEGQIMYMPNRKVLYVFSVDSNGVDWHVWEFNDEINSRLLLRMDSIVPELQVVDQGSKWIKVEKAREPIYKHLITESLMLRYL